MSSVSTPATTKSSIGSFGPDVFAAHLATLAGAPAWWLDRKRAAFETFSSLPLPKRTDESWRFSSIASLTLDGFAQRNTEAAPIVLLPVAHATSLTFVNNTALRGSVSAAKLPAGVSV